MEKLYSVNQVARDFFSGQISAPSIYNLIAEKKLNAIHIGRRILVPESALIRFCELNYSFQENGKEAME